MGSQTKIPLELVESVVNGGCVLFLGADADYSTSEWVAPPSRQQLANRLVQKYALKTESENFHKVLDEFLSQESDNYHDLREFMREQVMSVTQPGPLHKVIVNLRFDTIITNCYDGLLESAILSSGQGVVKVVNDVEVAYIGDKREVLLIYLAGRTDQPGTMVLTRRNHIEMENRLSEKLQIVKGYFLTKRLLFIGWNPEDEFLDRLYITATERLGQDKRRNYIVWSDPSPTTVSHWKQDNVEILSAHPLHFLQDLYRKVKQARLLEPDSSEQFTPIKGKMPYKSLSSFKQEDKELFYGRDVEIQRIHRSVLSESTLVLFGQSGAGKTSVLQAGIIPLLNQDRYNTIYVRTLDDPLASLVSIRREIIEKAGLDEGITQLINRVSDISLHDFLQHVSSRCDKIVVILDQFEELFTRPISANTRKKFWLEVSSCLNMPTPEVHFVFSLREDYLAYLDEARSPAGVGQPVPIPHILRNSYRLNTLDQLNARLAIVEPARRVQCQIEPILVDVLLGQEKMPEEVGKNIQEPITETPRWSIVELNTQVSPPVLQIVMDKLYRSALEAAGHTLPISGQVDVDWQPPQLTLTVEQYHQVGGAGQILGSYMREALDKVSDLGGDRNLAETLLKALVTIQGTRALLTENELFESTLELFLGFDHDHSRKMLSTTASVLVSLRLLQTFSTQGQVLFELMHDHLAAEISSWISKEEMQIKLVRELLNHEMDRWRNHDFLIAPEAFQLINKHRESLQYLNAEEIKLLFRSSLANGHEINYWSRKAREANLEVDEIEVHRAAIVVFIENHYSLSELRTLCFNLGVMYDDLPGDNLSSKARELIIWTLRRGQLDHLLGILITNRPESFNDSGIVTNLTGLYDALSFFDHGYEANDETIVAEFISHHFSLQRIRTLCFHLSCSYEDLQGDVKSEKAYNLVRWANQHKQHYKLLALLQNSKPSEFDEDRLSRYITQNTDFFVVFDGEHPIESQLLRFIVKTYDLKDLYALCVVLEIEDEWENFVVGDEWEWMVEEKAREIIILMKRTGQLDSLFDAVKTKTPDIEQSIRLPDEQNYAPTLDLTDPALLFRLHQFILTHYDQEEFKTLCFHFQINYEHLPASTFTGMVWETLRFMERRDYLPDLIAELSIQNPHFSAQVGFMPIMDKSVYLRSRTHRFIVESLNMEELNSLIFHMGKDSYDLAGETISAKARELILWVERHECFDELLTQLKHKRKWRFESELEPLIIKHQKPLRAVSEEENHEYLD